MRADQSCTFVTASTYRACRRRPRARRAPRRSARAWPGCGVRAAPCRGRRAETAVAAFRSRRAAAAAAARTGARPRAPAATVDRLGEAVEQREVAIGVAAPTSSVARSLDRRSSSSAARIAWPAARVASSPATRPAQAARPAHRGPEPARAGRSQPSSCPRPPSTGRRSAAASRGAACATGASRRGSDGRRPARRRAAPPDRVPRAAGAAEELEERDVGSVAPSGGGALLDGSTRHHLCGVRRPSGARRRGGAPAEPVQVAAPSPSTTARPRSR